MPAYCMLHMVEQAETIPLSDIERGKKSKVSSYQLFVVILMSSVFSTASNLDILKFCS